MSTKSQVLTLLMQHAYTFISGEEMAQQLTLSRTAVWKAINELKKTGYSISSSKKKGYCYQPTDIISAEGIHFFLNKKTPIQSIQVKSSSDSTMKEAKHALLEKATPHTLIIANHQNQSKGRFGRPFFSVENKGIYMSLILTPNQPLEEVAQYTIITAVAVSRAIDQLLHVQSKVKWVNDIYLNRKKVCGILSEAISDVESGQISSIVIGIGLNFSIQPEEFPKEIQEKVTSLFIKEEPTITRNQLIASIWQHFYALINQLPKQDFLDEYREKSFVLNKKVTFSQQGQTYEGTAININERGELVVQLTNGTTKLLSSGEISLKKIEN